MKTLGKVRPEYVKKTARELIDLYPDKFNTDFKHNKEVVNSLTKVPSARLRNRVAGYVTRLLIIAQAGETEEVDEDEMEEEEEE